MYMPCKVVFHLKYRYNFSIYFLFLLSFISAQHIVSGTVKDNNNNNLPGANVFIQSIGIGAIADFNGNFELTEIPNGNYKLTASLISYKNRTLEITVNNNDISNIEIILESAPISKNKIIVEGSRKKEKNTIQPVCKIRFNGVYKSFDQPIILLPPDLAVNNSDIYEDVFLRKSTHPQLILGISKQFKNGIKTGFLSTTNESRIFIQSSFAKMEIGRIFNSRVISVGAIYEHENNLNVEFDINFYDIIKGITSNKSNFTNNMTIAITLSSNFD